MNYTAGIDISKAKVDVCVLGAKTSSFQAPNTPAGHVRVAREIRKAGASLVVMEATGSYHVGLANHLHCEQITVAVVNPARIKDFVKASGRRNKTDKADAKALAEFGLKHEVRPYQPLAPGLEKLRELVKLRTDNANKCVQIKNQLKDPSFESETSRIMLKEQLEFFVGQRKTLEALIKALIRSNQELAKQVLLLQTISGVGEITAWVILAQTGGFERFDDSKAVAAFAGICPRVAQSGTSLNGRKLSKQGNAALRKAMHLAAMSAVRHPGLFQDHYLKRLAAGWPKMKALTALAHKLLRICYGVVTSSVPFDPKRALTNL